MINLSSHNLTIGEEKLLRRGLSFVPTPKFDMFRWVKDLHLFARKLRWHKHFKLVEKRESRELGIPVDILGDVRLLFSLDKTLPIQDGEGPFTNLKNKSVKMPPQNEVTCIGVFLKQAIQDLGLLSSTPQRYNCGRDEREAIKTLERNKSIIVKPSDKGGNVVLMTREYY